MMTILSYRIYLTKFLLFFISFLLAVTGTQDASPSNTTRKRRRSESPPVRRAKKRKTGDASDGQQGSSQDNEEGQEGTSSKGKKVPKRKDHLPTPEEKQIAKKFVEDLLEDESLPIPVKVPKTWAPDPALYGLVS
jgi:hypothetical protein